MRLKKIDKENNTLLELRNKSLTRNKTPSDAVKNISGNGNVEDVLQRTIKKTCHNIIFRYET